MTRARAVLSASVESVLLAAERARQAFVDPTVAIDCWSARANAVSVWRDERGVGGGASATRAPRVCTHTHVRAVRGLWAQFT